jgi:hypothetical protein
VKTLLTPEEYAVVEPHYGLDGAPNFENKHWHLRLVKPLALVAKRLEIALDDCEKRLDAARTKLLAARAQRVWPGRDEKVLTSWNGLMIRGMARAAAVFGRSEWLASAQHAADFVRTTLWRNGRLLATCKDGRAHLNAYLDDHAFMLDGLLELMQAGFRIEDFQFARDLADLLLAQFEDRERGGFFFVSHDHEKLIHRAKSAPDSATPSGNGIAAIALQRLGHLTGEPRYLNAAERALKLFYPMMERRPSAFSSLLVALEEWLRPPQTVVLRGPERELGSWHHDLAASYRPDTVALAIPTGVEGLPQTLAKPRDASVNAWVCRGVTCLAPITSREELKRALSA